MLSWIMRLLQPFAITIPATIHTQAASMTNWLKASKRPSRPWESISSTMLLSVMGNTTAMRRQGKSKLFKRGTVFRHRSSFSIPGSENARRPSPIRSWATAFLLLISAYRRGYSKDLLGFSLSKTLSTVRAWLWKRYSSYLVFFPSFMLFISPSSLLCSLWMWLLLYSVEHRIGLTLLSFSPVMGFPYLLLEWQLLLFHALLSLCRLFFVPSFSDVLQSKWSDAVPTVWIALLSCHLIQVAPRLHVIFSVDVIYNFPLQS